MVIKNAIKIWPLWDDISPSLIPYIDSKLNLDKLINIDFSEVKNYTSSGAAIILAKLIKIVDKNPDKRWNIHFDNNFICRDFLKEIGVADILDQRIQSKDMFWDWGNKTDRQQYSIIKSREITQISFPIYCIENKNGLGRENVEDFMGWLIDNLHPHFHDSDFRFEIFAKMLNEIAKNSCDHTQDDAFFGFDLYMHNESLLNCIFTFSDLGNGIHDNIKKYKEDNKEDWSKAGIVDSYHYAFQPGNSTGGIINRGIGMSMIQDCSNTLGFSLSIFDARSMGIVPKDLSHSSIRANFYDTTSPVGFNYFGKINL